MIETWPFKDPENLAVITLKQIVHNSQPILHVVHDSDDGGWQFLGGGDAREEDALLVALHRIVRLDPSVRELADLPLGWHARRKSPEEMWRRSKV